MFFKGIHTRIKIVLFVIVFLFILIIGKVFYIQVFQYKKLNNYASSLWSRNLPIEANRGIIYDINGTILADNITTTSLVLIPNQIKDKDNTSTKLAEILGVTKEEMDAVWGISFEARHASKPEITPYGKGKFCIVPDSFAYPLDEKDIASMFKADCAKYNFNSEQLPYLLTRHAPFVIVAPDPPGLQRESNITELYHGLMDRSPELMELFNTLSPAVFSTELPEGIIASPCCSRQEKSITIRLLNTTDALIVNNKDNIISRKDTVVWKKWQGGDGRITITMAKDEKIAEAIYSDLSLQERSLICELKDKERNTWEIILPAGLLEDFGYITLSLA